MKETRVTFKDIAKANESIRTMAIERKKKVKDRYGNVTYETVSKDYAEVNQRVKAFRMIFPMGSIITEIVSHQDGVVLMKTTIRDEDGNILSTGYAQEDKNTSDINKTSYIENAETSSVGRAIGFLSLGIDTSIASYDEVENAQNQQDEKTDDKALGELIFEVCKIYSPAQLEKMEQSKGKVDTWSKEDLETAIKFAQIKNTKELNISSSEETF